MRHLDGTAEEVLARIASSSHGVITRTELLRAGLTADRINRRLRSGALLREHRGVYRVGHRAPSLEARYLAAVVACGEGAVLSGTSAAHLLGLIKGPPPRPEVTAPTNRRVHGVKVRRFRRAEPLEAMTWGIPTTSVAGTLVDLAAVLAVNDLAPACHEAEIRHGTRPADARPCSPGDEGRPGRRSCAASCRETSASP